jgi:hypothetical protein
MVILKIRFHAVLGFAVPALLTVLAGCERDFSSPWIPTSPSDSGSVVASKPETPAKKDTSAPPVITVSTSILIESLSASDLRMNAGETKPAAVTVSPTNATSPLYEMTSSKPKVAEVTAKGIHGAGAGSATITVHALDGSNKTTHFHVIVDAIVDGCLLLPCLCLGKIDGNGNGKGKGNGDGGGSGATEASCSD